MYLWIRFEIWRLWWQPMNPERLHSNLLTFSFPDIHRRSKPERSCATPNPTLLLPLSLYLLQMPSDVLWILSDNYLLTQPPDTRLFVFNLHKCKLGVHSVIRCSPKMKYSIYQLLIYTKTYHSYVLISACVVSPSFPHSIIWVYLAPTILYLLILP